MSTTSTLSHEIADVLRNDILQERYRSGERMPSERDLANRFDANRGAVREALSQLEQLGIIRIQPGGARVQSINSAGLAILGPLMALNEIPDPALVDQSLQIFGAMSSLSASNAVVKASPVQLQQLQDLVAVIAEHTHDFRVMEPYWRELLQLVADIDDNLVVRLIGNDLKAQIVGQMMEMGINPELKHAAGTDLVGNLNIALAKKDGELAAKAISRHFDQLREAVFEAINIKRAGLHREAV